MATLQTQEKLNISMDDWELRILFYNDFADFAICNVNWLNSKINQSLQKHFRAHKKFTFRWCKKQLDGAYHDRPE